MATATTQDGVVLHYDNNGHGPAFIFAHAYPMNRTIWQPQITSFLDSWRTVAYDVRGFGRSTAPIDPSSYSQDRSVADLCELLDAIGVEKAVICGLSMGGNIALNFSLKHPDRTVGLIIVDTGAGSDDPRTFASTVNGWADAAEREGIEAFADIIMANPIFGEYSERGPEQHRHMRAIITANAVHGVSLTARRVLAMRPPVYALDQKLRAFKVPTLVVVGERDAACLAPGRYLSETIPTARQAIIPNTGHFNNLEAPETFNSVVTDFLRSVRA